MMTKTQTAPQTAGKRAAMRRQLLSCGAMAICLSTLALHAPLSAQASGGQAFQGTGTVVSGTVNINQTAALDTITIDTPQAVINWKPNDTTGASGVTVDFLPVGRSARFTGFGDFTVLNRIIPVDGNDVPIARMIALNGTITSDLFGQQPGGNVWFYSPGGILVGSTGVINVGSLVLTSRDIDTTGGLLGPSGQIRFRNPGLAGTDTSRVEIAAGANITAFNGTAGGSYIALVAPRIVQAGTVMADGSVALVAAEQADVRINNGLFDINVLAGSGDANGIVNTGRTGGPSDTSATRENRAYFVAVPKNQAMTMLLSGTIGFESASGATLTEGGIVLSAGHNIVGGALSDSVNGNTSASIQIGNSTFINTLDGAATDSIVGRASFGAPGPVGQIQFRKDATLSAANLVDFRIDRSQSITAGGNLTLRAGRNGTGGTVRLEIGGVPAPVGFIDTAGVINVTGNLLLDASGHGFSPNGGVATGGSAAIAIAGGGRLTAASILTRANGNGDQDDGGVGANGFGGTASVGAAQGGSITTSSLTIEANGTSTALVGTAGSGVGGNALVILTGGGAITVTNDLTISALGLGQIGSDISGQGVGGAASLNIFDAASSLSAGSTTIDASGIGGGTPLQLANPATPNTLVGGSGTGGIAALRSPGTANLGNLTLFANGIGGESQPTNNRANALGGEGQGGTVVLGISGGTTTVTNAALSANGHGGASGGTLGTTGRAFGGIITLDVATGAFQVGTVPSVDGNLILNANADIDPSDGGTVADARGGAINLTADLGGRITVNNQLDAQATAITSGGPFAPPVAASGIAVGGSVTLSTTSGSLSADTARIDTSARTASATGTAGNAVGGAIALASLNGGALSFNQLNSFDANGIGGDGAIGGTGTGGVVSIRAASGAISLGGRNFININGVAGISAPANPPQTGRGGEFYLEVTDETGTQFSFGEIYAAVSGGSAVPPSGFNGPLAPTHGFGGRATLIFAGPRTNGTLLSVLANGYGANGGEGHGGDINFSQTAGTTNIIFTVLGTDGFGGDGVVGANAGNGGVGIGGLLNTSFTDGIFSGDTLFLSSRGSGGAGATSDPQSSTSPGNGGVASGGVITALISGPTSGTAQVNIRDGLTADTGAVGGLGGNKLLFGPGALYATPGRGGSALAGNIFFTHSGNQLSDGSDGPANINLSARALGGNGGMLVLDGATPLSTDANGPDGGTALGGLIEVRLATPATSAGGGNYLLDSSGTGGDGGISLTGGNGGAGAGGTSRIIVDNINAGTLSAQLISEGFGGRGADGINGAGGNGGSGNGGTARAVLNGANGAVVADGTQYAVNGFGGAGGNGMVSAAAATPPATGFSGGQGGNGTGGFIDLETNDGRLTFSANNGGPALASRGTGGAGGNGANNPTGVGGNGSFGGVGSGGEITLRTNGGTIAVAQNAPLSIIVDGIGGAGGSAGTGSGGSGFSNSPRFTLGGRIRFEANDSAGSQGLITLNDATLQANGTGGAGRIELIDNSAGAGIRFNSLDASSVGQPNNTTDFTTSGSGIYANSRDGAIQLGGGVSYLRASGTIQVDAANTGGISAAGQINISGGNVIARHTAPGANTPTIFAGDRVNVTSSLIDFQAGTLISANAGISLQSDSSVNFDRLLSSNATGNGSIFVDAVTNIVGTSATSATTTSGNAIILNSRTGNVQFGKLDSNTQIIVDARNGSITGTRARSGSSMTMDAGGSITFDTLVSDAFMLNLNAGTNVIGNGLVSGGSSAINAGGNVQFGTFTAANSLSIRAGGTITGTSATATLIGGPGMLLSGIGGVNLGSVISGGETGLIADSGAVVVGNLRSNGLILAEGRSVTIAGSGGLKFTELNATAGDARVTATSGDLTVQSGMVSGTATLTTQGGDLTAQNLGANRIALNSNRTARIAGTVTGTSALDVTSTGATIVDGIATGGVITMTSGDIVIGSAGRIGTGGTTSAVTLINGDSGVRTYVGGNDQANAYSLSAAEMLRIFGTNVTIRAPRTTAQSNAALGSSRPPDVIIGAFTFNGATASNGNLGAGGTLSIITPGSARVIGAAQLTNMTSSNGFALQADQGIEVILGQGSIRLTGAGSGALGGVLSLKADDIAVATSNAISDIASAPDIAAINTRLGRNDGITSADGALSAATINLDATGGLYIQNSGASDRTNDRRGFSTNALNITTGGTSTRIVINGQIANAAGLFQTGADTIRPTMINGVAAGPGGAFALGSTINGCLIANAAGCNAAANFDQHGFIQNQLATNGRRKITVRGLLLLGLGRLAIHIRDVDPLRDEPLLDEPITGSGNDDLWIEDTGGE